MPQILFLKGLAMWWGDMAKCLYPAFIGASDACQRLGLCKVKIDMPARLRFCICQTQQKYQQIVIYMAMLSR